MVADKASYLGGSHHLMPNNPHNTQTYTHTPIHTEKTTFYFICVDVYKHFGKYNLTKEKIFLLLLLLSLPTNGAEKNFLE